MLSLCCCSCGYPIPAKLNPRNTSCPADVSGVAASRTGSVSHAQQNSVIKLAPPKGRNEPSFLWTGDRWQSACRSTVVAQGVTPIGPDLGCVKAWVRCTHPSPLLAVVRHVGIDMKDCWGQDYQYWSVLEFDDDKMPPLPRQQVWSNEIALDIDAHPVL